MKLLSKTGSLKANLSDSPFIHDFKSAVFLSLTNIVFLGQVVDAECESFPEWRNVNLLASNVGYKFATVTCSCSSQVALTAFNNI